MKRVISIAITVIFLMGMLPAQSVVASCPVSVEVTNIANDGAGSLRQALGTVCTGGVITFYSTLSGLTITLDPGVQLSLERNVTIDASALADRVTIDADNMGRVLWVYSGVTATLNSLRISHGNPTGDGGGIYNLGNLTVINTVLYNNLSGYFGGGIYNAGTLAVIDSRLDSNSTAGFGGGIFNNGGSVTVTNSIVEESGAGDGGGGMYNASSGTLTVINSTLSQNTAASGGGIRSESGTVTTVTGSMLIMNNTTDPNGSGGGLFNGPGGTMTVANSTLAGNTANQYGGGIANYGTLTLKNSTLSGNTGHAFAGGGLANYNNTAILHYANTIIANSPTGGDCANVNGGLIPTNINNQVEDGSCGGTMGDPMLGGLANNGGPTQTMALLEGSPAIDAGDDATCAAAPVSGKDQRGVTRPQGAHCDIGAYEKINTIIFLPMIFR